MKPLLRVGAALALTAGSLGFLGNGLVEEPSSLSSAGGPRMMLLGVCLSMVAILLWPLAKAPFRRSLDATRLDRCLPLMPQEELRGKLAPSEEDWPEEAGFDQGQALVWRRGHTPAPSRWYEWSDVPAGIEAEEALG
jgi:hypothetical protein